ncbi:MAG: dephospho-CoA kinase [Gemmatimonadota bacterium]
MIRLGLTGSLGAGKSTVGRLFEAWGATRMDADELAREAVVPGSPAMEAICRAWGARVLDETGRLDRAALRRLVAADPEARAKLEAIVHPEVARLRAEGRARAARDGVELLVEEVPLLFEVGMEEEFDALVVVDAPVALRRERVLRNRGLSAGEFDALEAAQGAPAEKRRRADFLLWNARGREELADQARGVWEALAAKDRPPPVLWRVDLHMHTHHSKDCLSEPARVVERAVERGLERIAITDHDEIDGAFEARELAPETVIVGEEVRTAEGLDLIGLFLTRWIAPGSAFLHVAEEILGQGGIVYLPHPFDAHRGADEAFLDRVAHVVDLVEGFNARVHDPDRNRKAREWADRHGLPVGAGSDAHLLSEIGRGRLRLPPFQGPGDFLAACARGRIEGRASGWWVHLGSTWAKVRGRRRDTD